MYHKYFLKQPILLPPQTKKSSEFRKIYAQFWPFSFASSMILNAEQRTGQRYDWILRARPDVPRWAPHGTPRAKSSVDGNPNKTVDFYAHPIQN